MTTKFSNGLLEALATSGSLRDVLNGVSVAYFSGIPPASVHDAVGMDNTMLANFTVDGDGVTGGTFSDTVETYPTHVALVKDPDEVWEAVGLEAAGAGVLPTFARIYLTASGDPLSADPGEIRIQCPIGPTVSNGILRNGTVAENDALSLPIFFIGLPTGN